MWLQNIVKREQPQLLPPTTPEEEGLACKAEGNELWKANHFTEAIDCYTKAIRLLTKNVQDQSACHFNKAKCHLKLVRLQIKSSLKTLLAEKIKRANLI